MQHHFSIEVAAKHGVGVAIFLDNLAFWLMSNKAKNKNFHDGRYWSYNTIESFVALFPYWSVKNIRTIIKNAKESDLIMIGHFSKRKSDRTQWFTLTDYGMTFYASINYMQVPPPGTIEENIHLPKPANEAGRAFPDVENEKTPVASHLPKPANPFAQTGTALPYIKPDNKQKIRERGAEKNRAISPLSLKDFLPDEENQKLLQGAAQKSGKSENELMIKFKALMKTKEIEVKHWQDRLSIFLINEKPSNQAVVPFSNVRQSEPSRYGSMRDFTEERLQRESEASNNKRLN